MQIDRLNLNPGEAATSPLSVDRQSTPNDEGLHGLQCFIDAGVAVWCGCGAIYDLTAWSDCPRCCASQGIFAVPLTGFRAKAV